MLQDLNSDLEIDQASCVADGFKKLAMGNYDVVVSDYEMPQKNGLEFLEELHKQNNQIPFILFTGKGREYVAVMALNMGADGYFNKQGSPETVYGELAHGITQAIERSKIKSALEESEKRYRTIMEQAADSIIVHDKNRRIINVNEATSRQLGYTRKELLSMSITDISSTATEDAMEDLWPKILAGQTVTLEANHKIKSGSIIPVEVTLGPLFVDKEIQVIGIARDITERKKAEDKSEKNQKELDLIINSSPIIVFYKDKEGKFLRVNEAFAKALQIPSEKLVGKTVFDFYSAEIAQNMTNDDLEVLKSECPKLGIIEQYKSASGLRWVQTDKVPIIDENGSPKGVIGFAQDITECKKAEEKILWLASFPMLNPNPVLEVSFEGNISYLNSAAEYVFPDLKKAGLSHPLFSGWNDLLATFRNEKAQTLGRNIKIKDNWFRQQFNVHIETQQVRIYVTNITKTILAEKTLLENEAKFRIYMENSPVAVFVANTEGKYEYVNEAASALLGYSAKELLGMSIQQVAFVGEPKIFSAVKNTGCASCETVLRSKDGLPVFVILNSVRLPDGKLMAFCENITERKKTEDKLRESIHKNELINEKLNVVGSLTRHDVGNKLMVVKSNMYLLKKQISDNPKLAKYFEGIDSALKSSDVMFEFSRFYEKIGVEKPSEVDVAQCFNQAVALLPDLGTLKIVNDYQGIEVIADSLLKQLFYNFLDNSLKYGEKVTQIRLHFTKEAEGVKLFYEDNGVGVAEANKPKLFHEGFTTGKSHVSCTVPLVYCA